MTKLSFENGHFGPGTVPPNTECTSSIFESGSEKSSIDGNVGAVDHLGAVAEEEENRGDDVRYFSESSQRNLTQHRLGSVRVRSPKLPPHWRHDDSRIYGVHSNSMRAWDCIDETRLQEA